MHITIIVRSANLRIRNILFLLAYVIGLPAKIFYMAVHQGTGAPPVLAYNANSDRGWNDPPTMAFAATQSSSTPRKRLDLRKRVAHDCITGSSGLNTGMANLSLNTHHPPTNVHGQQNTYHHNQNFTKMSSPPINGTIVPPAGSSTVTQPNFNSQTQNYYSPAMNRHLSIPHYGADQTPLVPGSMTPPVYSFHGSAHHMSHASSMPNLQHLQMEDTSSVSQTGQGSHTPLFNINPPFQTSSTVGEPSTTASTSTDSTHVGKPLFCLDSQATQPVLTSPLNDYQKSTASCGIAQPSINAVNSEQTMMNRTMPSLSTSDNLDLSHHVRSNSVPDIMPHTDRLGTPPASLGAPPTEGYYTRSLSPNSSRQKTPSPVMKERGVPNDDKLPTQSKSINYHDVMDKLNFSLDKCSNTLEKKAYDDVKRKLDILEYQWSNDNLSINVRDMLACLASAMTDGNFEEAYRIHQSLMVDYSSEVSQWMIGIKKLIAASKA